MLSELSLLLQIPIIFFMHTTLTGYQAYNWKVHSMSILCTRDKGSSYRMNN